MPITPICSGDSFYFAVPIFSEKSGSLLDYESEQYVCLVTGVCESSVPANFRMSTASISYPIDDETVDSSNPPTPSKKFPQIDFVLNNMRKMPFFAKDYYKADLNRICDAEELVSEWYPIDIYDQ